MFQDSTQDNLNNNKNQEEIVMDCYREIFEAIKEDLVMLGDM